MKFLLFFSVCLVICFAKTKQIKIPILNENDEIYSYKIVKQRPNIHEMIPNIPLNTPREIQIESRRIFPFGSPNITLNSPMWGKNVSICNKKEIDTTYSYLETNFTKTQNPCELPRGMYMWMITSDYQMSFGEYFNNIEWVLIIVLIF